MKPFFPVALGFLAVLAGCKNEERSREPILGVTYTHQQAQKKLVPTGAPLPTAGQATPTPTPQTDYSLKCEFKNQLHGGRDRADGEKTIKVTTTDEGQSETLSTNSENTIFLESHKGMIRLRVEARKGGYTRGQAEFSISAKQMLLSPDNQTEATGFTEVLCSAAVPPASAKSSQSPIASAPPVPTGGAPTGTPGPTATPTPTVAAQKFKWSCSALGFTSEEGEPLVYTKILEFTAEEESKSVVLLDAMETKKAVKIEAYSQSRLIGVRYSVKGATQLVSESSGYSDASAPLFTFFKPVEGDPSLHKVTCKKL